MYLTYADKPDRILLKALGFGYLFSEQVVGFSTQYRVASHKKLMQAIRRAVAKCSATNSKSATTAVTPHVDIFKELVLSTYGSVAEAWQAFNSIGDTPDKLTRADFKIIISSTLKMKITSKQKGKLRYEKSQSAIS
jgi:hypothetical protein